LHISGFLLKVCEFFARVFDVWDLLSTAGGVVEGFLKQTWVLFDDPIIWATGNSEWEWRSPARVVVLLNQLRRVLELEQKLLGTGILHLSLAEFV